MGKGVFKRCLSVILTVSLLLGLCACISSGGSDGAAEITIAYQGGIGYAPVHILEAKALIESNYK